MKTNLIVMKSGISRVPSEVVGADGTASDIVGLRSVAGSLRPVQHPVRVMEDMEAELLLVHTAGGEKHYIGVKDGDLVWWVAGGSYNAVTMPEDFDASSVSESTSVGNTVILLSGGRPWYLLWNGGSGGYKNLGSSIPRPSIRFTMSAEQPNDTPSGVRWSSVFRSEYDSAGHTVPLLLAITSGAKTTIDWGDHTAPNHYIPLTTFDWDASYIPESYKDIVFGLYRQNLSDIAKRKGFANPFFVRYGVRLYDGSYAYMSQPVLMLPTRGENTAYHCKDWGMFWEISTICYTSYSLLYARVDTDYSGWEDVVEGVDIFVTRQFDVHEAERLTAAYVLKHGESADDYSSVTDASLAATAFDTYLRFGNQDGVSADVDFEVRADGDRNPTLDGIWFYHLLKPKAWSKLQAEMVEGSVFRKLCEMPLRTSGWVSVRSFVKDGVMENIDTQESLMEDDYYGHTNLYADGMYAYNGRLHLWGLERSFFDGFGHFSNSDFYRIVSGWVEPEETQRMLNVYVTINTESGQRVVRLRDEQTREAIGSGWFYYPDPRAVKADVFGPHGSGNRYVTLTLKEHPTMNGAYWISEPAKQPYFPIVSSEEPSVSNEPEVLSGQIAQSEADNPWVFGAGGYQSVGNGDIIGMSTNTHALTQGEFGTFPLVVFTTEGIWGVSIDTAGRMQYVKPLNREVCSDRRSIVETDDAVFFVSVKGLMRLTGKNAVDVSAALDGKVPDGWSIPGESIAVSLRDSRIAYDYRDRLLWIFREGQSWSWLYDIGHDAWTRVGIGGWSRPVRDYPDTLLVGGGDGTYHADSLLSRPDASEDNGIYAGRIVTRALHFGSVLNLKSLSWARHLCDTQGIISMDVWGSDDLHGWYRLNTIRGKAWRWFRVSVDITGMAATDTYDALALGSEERRRVGMTEDAPHGGGGG